MEPSGGGHSSLQPEPRGGGPKAYLEFTVDGTIRRVPITQEEVCRIGRDVQNTVVLKDFQVSRHHALVDCRGPLVHILTDLGSRNGTLLNEQRVSSPARLSHGDRITIGPYSFTFCCVVELPPAAPPESVVGMTQISVALQAITVLVADIRGYTAMAQRLDHERLSNMMGVFFGDCGALLRRQGAWGQKYIGDAVMAIWAHGEQMPDPAATRRVIDCVPQLLDIAAGLQGLFALDTPVRIGIGINTGVATLGNLGSESTADYTALGDTVNKAFRLETATKDSDCDVLIGQGTYECLDAPLQSGACRPCKVALKGYGQLETAYALSVSSLRELLGPPTQTR